MFQLGHVNISGETLWLILIQCPHLQALALEYRHEQADATGNKSMPLFTSVVVVGWVRWRWIVVHTSPICSLHSWLSWKNMRPVCLFFTTDSPSVAVVRCRMRGLFVVVVLMAMLVSQITVQAQLTCKFRTTSPRAHIQYLYFIQLQNQSSLWIVLHCIALHCIALCYTGTPLSPVDYFPGSPLKVKQNTGHAAQTNKQANKNNNCLLFVGFHAKTHIRFVLPKHFIHNANLHINERV